MNQILTRIKRGAFEGHVTQDKNQYFAVLLKEGKILKTSAPFFDQDEAEVEVGTMLDDEWRKKPTHTSKLMRR